MGICFYISTIANRIYVLCWPDMIIKGTMDNDLPPEDQGRQEPTIQQLEQSIQVYRNKIKHYQALEEQIKDISKSISQSPSAPQLPRGSKPSDSRAGAAKSSNKKIKLYELQKKLKKILSEFQERENTFTKSKGKEQELLRQIQRRGLMIDEEKRSKEMLQELEIKISRDLERTGEQVTDQVVSLEKSVKRKEIFNFERTKVRNQIRNLRNVIDRWTKKQTTSELSLSNSEIVSQKEDLDRSEGIWQMSFQNDQEWLSREKGRAELFFSRLEISRERNTQLSQKFYDLRKDFAKQQILVQHHRLTTTLQSSQLKKYEMLIEGGKKRIGSSVEETEAVGERVRRVEGERGYLRGKVGIAIEQLRLVRGVNSLIQSDIQSLRERCDHLRLLKNIIDPHP